MNSTGATYTRHFYRDADRAVLGGVCAGLADYLGFNLKTTRFLTLVAFLMVMPVAVIAYLMVVFVVPSVSRTDDADAFQQAAPVRRRSCRRRRSKTQKTAQAMSATTKPKATEIIDTKCSALEERLAVLERRVTSRRFQLDQELAKL